MSSLVQGSLFAIPVSVFLSGRRPRAPRRAPRADRATARAGADARGPRRAQGPRGLQAPPGLALDEPEALRTGPRAREGGIL